MNLLRIHECLCDRTRLRIVHLLLGGPLCVCHLQDVLREPQVKISRHLAYLRRRGMVAAERCGQWMVYRLPAPRSPLLEANLACLQDCSREEPVFQIDLRRLARLKPEMDVNCPACVRGGGGKRQATPARRPSHV
jgi:ArsR family transcriptional regulator